MYNKILVSLALNHGYSSTAINLAKNLRSQGGEIIAVHVFEPAHSSVSLYVPEEEIENIRKASKVSLAERVSKEENIVAVTLTGYAGLTITDYANKVDADCIIVGSHKPGLQDFFLGSTAARIMRYAKCSVHVLR